MRPPRFSIKPIHVIAPMAALAVYGLMTLPSASAETRAYDLKNFSQINVSAGIKVVLKQGAYAVSVEQDQGKFNDIVLKVEGQKLRIARPDFHLGESPHYTVTVTAPAYSGVEASSSASVTGENLKFDNLRIDVSSAARATITGTCSTLRADASSSAKISGQDLKCETAKVDASSSAHVDVYATRVAEVDASSSAHVTFHGQPAELKKDLSSGAKLSTK